MAAQLFETDRTIRVGIIGASGVGWGRLAHLPAIATIPGWEVTAVSTTRRESAQATAEEFGVPAAYGEPDPLIESEDVDLVIVAVRVEFHDELLQKVARAGKPVYSEWPSGSDLQQTRELRDLFAAEGIYAVPGLQARSTAAVRYLRDLVKDGYLGRVLSSTVVGRGSQWGDVVDPRNAYLLDDALGGTMQTIPFGHTIDGVCSVLGEFESIAAMTAIQQPRVQLGDSGKFVEKTTPDQLLLAGRLQSGAMITAHYHGGVPTADEFRWEIRGTDGDIVVTAPNGNMQLSPLTIRGAKRGEELHELPVPASYVTSDPSLSAPAASVAETHLLIDHDLRHGTRLAPTFDHAVTRKLMFDALRRAADTGQTQKL